MNNPNCNMILIVASLSWRKRVGFMVLDFFLCTKMVSIAKVVMEMFYIIEGQFHMINWFLGLS